MADLVAFLKARLDEDEQVARAAMPGPWIDGVSAPHLADGIVYGQSTWPGDLGQACDVRLAHVKAGNAAHIAHWDPARVLAEVEAKRAIIGDHLDANADYDCASWDGSGEFGTPPVCSRCEERHDAAPWPCLTLRALALPFVGHPDFDESWKP